MQVLTDKKVITKKEHRCFSCLTKYPSGTKMRYQSNIYEGDFGSMYVCEGCDELISRHRDVFLDDGVFWEGGVRESMVEEKVNANDWWNSLTLSDQIDLEIHFGYYGHDIGTTEEDIIYMYKEYLLYSDNPVWNFQ